MPFPNESTQFKSGQSGNPAGYSRRRRIADALHALIDELGADRRLAEVMFAKAIGDSRKLKTEDGYTLDPSLNWFTLMLDRLDGDDGADDAPESKPRITFPASDA